MRESNSAASLSEPRVTCPACGLELRHRPLRNKSTTGQGRAGERAAGLNSAAVGLGRRRRRFARQTLLLRHVHASRCGSESLWPTLTLCFGADRPGRRRVGSARGASTPTVREFDRATRLFFWPTACCFRSRSERSLLVAWSFLASAYGMTILRETAQGVDAVENWPNVLALEDLGEIAYVANSLATGRARPARRPFRSGTALEFRCPGQSAAASWCCFPFCFCRCSPPIRRRIRSRCRSGRACCVTGRHGLDFYLTTCAVGARRRRCGDCLAAPSRLGHRRPRVGRRSGRGLDDLLPPPRPLGVAICVPPARGGVGETRQTSATPCYPASAPGFAPAAARAISDFLVDRREVIMS